MVSRFLNHKTHAKGVGEEYGGRLLYLKGYREGSAEDRILLLEEAIKRIYK